jgi:hypothetical protein
MPSMVETSSGRGAALPMVTCGTDFLGPAGFPASCGKAKLQHQRAEKSRCPKHEKNHDLMVPDAASQVTAAWRK